MEPQPGAAAAPRTVVMHHDSMLAYDFGPYHPLRPERITAGMDLMTSAGLLVPARDVVAPEVCDLTDLERVHSPAYIEAIAMAGAGTLRRAHQARFGLHSTDNPPFPDMHRAAALICGATTQAVRAVLAGRTAHTFIPAGGWHHAHRERASGFCIYNDAAVAAAVALDESAARVLYLDFDCHHGDGVQWIFYDEPRVLTVSFHESGQFLFPGTGGVHETGDGEGHGFSINVPLAPFTGDDDWREALLLLPEIAHRFQPDIIISNHGCDTHAWDMLTHLSLTTRSLQEQVRLTHALAHEVCGGRWVAVGSGGYQWLRVVPRAWSIVWAEMSQRSLPRELPGEWAARWSGRAAEPLPAGFLDEADVTETGRDDDPAVRAQNRDTVRRVREVHGLARG